MARSKLTYRSCLDLIRCLVRLRMMLAWAWGSSMFVSNIYIIVERLLHVCIFLPGQHAQHKYMSSTFQSSRLQRLWVRWPHTMALLI